MYGTHAMTYRKAPRKTAAKQQWDRFVSSTQPIITASGIPAAFFSSIDDFDGLLCRGYVDEDPSEFRIDSLNPNQYNALMTLTESYFAAGYEWFTPLALRPADQDTLRKRFAK
jgi:hypothetical protein